MSQYRDNLPWFPMYASNLISDERYRMMSAIEKAVWISVLLECWSNGSVPADLVSLSKWLGLSLEEVKAGLTDRVLSFFKEVNGRLISPKLEEHWAKHTKRTSKLSDSCKKGAKRRWDKTSEGIATPLTTLIATPLPTPMASLNTLQSNTIRSNPSPIKEVTVDPWLVDFDSACNAYDAASNGSGNEAINGKARMRI